MGLLFTLLKDSLGEHGFPLLFQDLPLFNIIIVGAHAPWTHGKVSVDVLDEATGNSQVTFEALLPER